MTEYFLLLASFAAGFLLAWFLRKREFAARETLLRERLRLAEEKLALFETLPEKMATDFRRLASQALQESTDYFVKLTKELFEGREKAISGLTKPLEEHLALLRQEIQNLERERRSAYTRLEEKLRSLVEEHLPRLENEARQLKRVLDVPQSRGQWGEIQLKRLVELAGLLKHCDFYPQKSFRGSVRPDLVIHLPGERLLVVDAKAPLAEKEGGYAKALRRHIDSLAQKEYWQALKGAFLRVPDFVILFLPAENFLSQAYREDPEILEYAARKRVILATPLTLLSMLKAVALSWREEAFVRNAEEIIKSGQDLYRRLEIFAGHLKNLGRSLEQSVNHFNQLVSSFKARLLPAAKRFEELGLTPPSEKIKASGELKIEKTARKDLDL